MDPADRERLVRLELALARRDPALADGPLADLLHPAFQEHGASGRRWDRAEVVVLLAGPPTDVEMTDVAVVPVAEDVALVTWRSIDPSASVGDAWRSSLWVVHDGRWRLRFHQGTRAAAG